MKREQEAGSREKVAGSREKVAWSREKVAWSRETETDDGRWDISDGGHPGQTAGLYWTVLYYIGLQ